MCRFIVAPMYPGHINLWITYNQTCLALWKFLRLENSEWDFLGVKFLVQGVFGVLIFAPIQSFPSLDIWSTPPGKVTRLWNTNDVTCLWSVFESTNIFLEIILSNIYTIIRWGWALSWRQAFALLRQMTQSKALIILLLLLSSKTKSWINL